MRQLYTDKVTVTLFFFFLFDVEIKRIKQKSKILTAPLTNSSILCGLTCGLFTVIRSLKKPCNTMYKHEERKFISLVNAFELRSENSSLLEKKIHFGH